jgi:broad specificity phosphatase PhoE
MIQENKVLFENQKKLKIPFAKSSSSTVIYLVRHAEKEKDGTRDPNLTKAGFERAEKLRKILENTAIDHVFSTDYKRTNLTAKPTAEAFGKTIKSYNPRDLVGFAQEIKAKYSGKTSLVVGHSNTTPHLVNALAGIKQFTDIDESDYGHFFVVSINEKGKAEVFDLQF